MIDPRRRGADGGIGDSVGEGVVGRVVVVPRPLARARPTGSRARDVRIGVLVAVVVRASQGLPALGGRHRRASNLEHAEFLHLTHVLLHLAVALELLRRHRSLRLGVHRAPTKVGTPRRTPERARRIRRRGETAKRRASLREDGRSERPIERSNESARAARLGSGPKRARAHDRTTWRENARAGNRHTRVF